MGEFSFTCSISGLSIPGGTPVRCLLLTATPYPEENPRQQWLVRTPPIRAEYNSYGTIEKVNKEDLFTANLWLRGLREDLVERGIGDNSYHDDATLKSMSFENLLDALRSGRVRVRQDVKNFWRRPYDRTSLVSDKEELKPLFQRVSEVLTSAGLSVSAIGKDTDKYVVDEPVPGAVRVRYGQYMHGVKHLAALATARKAIEKAGFVGVVAAGSGRYADDADLLVFPAPPREGDKNRGPRGPQWDMSSDIVKGEHVDRHLQVRLAMVREDVWQAMINYPRKEYVHLDCINCGQQSSYHAKDLKCPNKSINNRPYKKHDKDSVYTHEPIFSTDVPHTVVASDWREEVIFGLAAFKEGVRAGWSKILDYNDRKLNSSKRHEEDEGEDTDTDAKDPSVDKALQAFFAKVAEARKAEQERLATLPKDERDRIEAEAQESLEAFKREQQDKIDNPVFGDFEINDYALGDYQSQQRMQGAWIFRRSSPGVIGIAEHLAMCMADKVDVPSSALDSLAELAAFDSATHMVGAVWKPAVSTGPQYPDWNEYERFARTLADISRTVGVKYEENCDKEYQTLPMTLEEALTINKA